MFFLFKKNINLLYIYIYIYLHTYMYVYVYIYTYIYIYLYIHDPFPSSTQQPSPPTFVGPSCPSHGKRRRLLIGESEEPVLDGLGSKATKNVAGALGSSLDDQLTSSTGTLRGPPAMPLFPPEIRALNKGLKLGPYFLVAPVDSHESWWLKEPLLKYMLAKM